MLGGSPIDLDGDAVELGGLHFHRVTDVKTWVGGVRDG